jgi:hypothetical protein
MTGVDSPRPLSRRVGAPGSGRSQTEAKGSIADISAADHAAVTSPRSRA